MSTRRIAVIALGASLTLAGTATLDHGTSPFTAFFLVMFGLGIIAMTILKDMKS